MEPFIIPRCNRQSMEPFIIPRCNRQSIRQKMLINNLQSVTYGRKIQVAVDVQLTDIWSTVLIETPEI